MTMDVELVASDAAIDVLRANDVIELAASDPTALPYVAPKPPVFGAGKAFASFLFLLLGQVFAGIGVMVAGTIIALVLGQDIAAPAFAQRLTTSATAPLLILAGIVSALVALAIARFWAWHIVRDKSSDGIGMTSAPASQLLRWAGLGTVVAMFYLAAAQWLVPFDPSTPVGPLATAATGGPMNRIAFAILALVFAPVVEEFFFRGLLLKGFTTSWGAGVGSIVVTILFVLLHLGETFRYWPATIAVTLMAIGTLAARRLTGSLAPAVALHGSYNLVIVLAVLVSP